jgi:uncharacterized protein (DUF983 family)
LYGYIEDKLISQSGTVAMSHTPARSFWTDLARGLRGRCPCCGEGRMFTGFLKVAERCDVCGEELFHHRADDFPAYLVILIVGHVVVPSALFVETTWSPPYWVHLALWLPLTLGLAVGLLQPLKGAVVAAQWRMGMHGFGEAKRHGRCGGKAASGGVAHVAA